MKNDKYKLSKIITESVHTHLYFLHTQISMRFIMKIILF